MKYIAAALPLMFLVNANASDVSESSELRKQIDCIPIEGISDLMGKLDGLDSDQRDTVDGRFLASIAVNDDGVLPERFFMRTGDDETAFTIEDDGRISNFDTVNTATEISELCIDDPSRAGQPKSNDAYSFSMQFAVTFNEAAGEHSLASLKDGGKDGRAFYKKMVPGPLAMMVPKFKYVTITYEDETTLPQIHAVKNGEIMEGLSVEPFYEQHVVSIKELEKMGADSLRVVGGPYRISPSPSPEKMEKFRGEDED